MAILVTDLFAQFPVAYNVFPMTLELGVAAESAGYLQRDHIEGLDVNWVELQVSRRAHYSLNVLADLCVFGEVSVGGLAIVKKLWSRSFVDSSWHLSFS